MINWLEIVDSALKTPDSHQKSGNQGGRVGTNNTHQDTDLKRNLSLGSHFPTFPTATEEGREDRYEKCNPSSFKTPAGGGVTDESAPHEEPIEHACLSCDHFRRPGLSDGFCAGGREDLPPAYTPGHPLRRRPDDAGANCPNWVQHWSFPRVLPGKKHEGTESPANRVAKPLKSN